MKKTIFIATAILSMGFLSCKHTDCSKNTSAYENGYGYGGMGALSGTSNCSDFIRDWNNQDVNSGNQITESDCFCEGYDDGYNKRPDKYESK